MVVCGRKAIKSFVNWTVHRAEEWITLEVGQWGYWLALPAERSSFWWEWWTGRRKTRACIHLLKQWNHVWSSSCTWSPRLVKSIMTRCLRLGPGVRAQGRCRFLALVLSGGASLSSARGSRPAFWLWLAVSRAEAVPTSSAWSFPPEPPSLLRSGRWVRLPPAAERLSQPHVRARGGNPGAESRGGVSGGCIPCADEPALEPGLLKPLSGRWVSWNSCRLRPRGQRPPKVRCPLFPGCGYSAERLEVALGRAGRKTHSQPSGSFLTGTPHGQEAVPCELAQVGIDGGAGLGGGQERDRDTGTSEVMGTALLWAWVHSCVCVRERQRLSNCLLYMLSLLYLKFTSTKLLNFSECAFYRTD